MNDEEGQKEREHDDGETFVVKYQVVSPYYNLNSGAVVFFTFKKRGL